MEDILIGIMPQTLDNRIEKIVRKVFEETQDREYKKRLFTINQARKELDNMHFSTLQKKIEEGFIKTTTDGKYISGLSIMNYLLNENADSVL